MNLQLGEGMSPKRVYGSYYLRRNWALGFRVKGLWFRVLGLGFIYIYISVLGIVVV